MSAKVDLLVVELTAEQPLSVSAPEATGLKGTDLPIAREPFRGEPYVPTTGVMGALREHARLLSSVDADRFLRLFGGRPPGDDDAPLRPSVIRALGTALQRGAGDPSGVRTQTAIDRFTGAARDGSLRSREHLGRGARLDLYLVLLDPETGDRQALRAILQQWRPHLGGARSVGFGAATLTRVKHHVLDLGQRGGLAEWLQLGGPGTWDTESWEDWPLPDSGGDDEIRIRFTVATDLHVGTGRRKDRVAQFDRTPAGPLIPGSAVKGAFRSRAELILRTLGKPACASTAVPGADRSVSEPCEGTYCLACRLFGYSPASRDDHTGRRSALWFSDATVCRSQEAQRTHVAIDRFTGGQSHGLLFTQEVVSSGDVEIVVRVADARLREQAEALLSAVALDIHDGFVGIGHGTARGMGSLRLADDCADECRRVWRAGREKVLESAERT